LEVSSLDEEGPTLHWLGSALKAREALQASERLSAAIKAGSRSFAVDNDDRHGPHHRTSPHPQPSCLCLPPRGRRGYK